MKKALLLLGLIVLPAALFAQGTVNFANSSTTRITTNSTAQPPPGQLANVAGNTQTGFTVGLYIAPQGTTDPNAFQLMGPTTPSFGALAPGQFNGNPPGGQFFVVSNNTGQAIAFQVRAWSTFAGTTYETARNVQNAYRGWSAIGEVTPATGLVLTPNLFGTGAGQIGGFVLTPNTVPEPSSIALGLLGLGAIALFRRRK
ncbi:MAG TPA: PEP-CTERM sorting domain-containing protein [Verrucomicrobiae bacterium]|jgi:hypothetical protein